MGIYQRLIYTVFLSIMLQDCYAKVGKASNHVTPIYINTADSSIKASVTDLPEKKPAIGRTYYWYSANKVCFTNGAYSGKLLHGQYSSYHPNHFLLAQGQFVRGLKDGRWMRWLPNGVLHEVINYKNGLLHGYYEIYSPNGHIQQRIYYRNGARTGKTKIFSQDGKDSVITPKQTAVDRRKTGVKGKEKAGDSAGEGRSGPGGKTHKSESRKSKANDSTQSHKKTKSDSAKVRTKQEGRERDSIKHKFHFPKRLLKKDSANGNISHSRLPSVDSRLR